MASVEAPSDFQTRQQSAVATTKQPMRKILITLVIVVPFVVAVLAGWIFAGRQISLFLDRFGTIEVTSTRINSIAYQGNGTGGILHVNDVELSLNDSNGPAPSIGTTKNDQLALADTGKGFCFWSGADRNREPRHGAAGGR